MNVQGIVKKYLEANGYDGLLNHDNPCACLKGDLATCTQFVGNEGIPVDCLPGYKREATEEEIDDCGAWVICEEKPEVTEDKPKSSARSEEAYERREARALARKRKLKADNTNASDILEALKQAHSDLDRFNPDALSDGIMGKIKNAIKLAQGE